MLFLTDMRAAQIFSIDGLTAPVSWSAITPDPATATLEQPLGTAMADDTLYIADAEAGHVVVLTAAMTSIVDTAAHAIGPMSSPRGVSVSGDRIIVADTGNHRIVAGSVSGAAAWTAYGSPLVKGADTTGAFLAPVSVFIDAAGRICICDAGLQRLVRIDDVTGAGWVEITLPPGARPYGVSAGPGTDIMVTDLAHGRVYGVTSDDAVTVLIDGGPGRAIVAPVAAVVDDDTIVIADAATAQLSAWTPDPESGDYALTAQLRGDPGPMPGPPFSAVSGLTYGKSL